MNCPPTPLSLHLVYGPKAADDVLDMVRKEWECCPFLRFDFWGANDEVHLLITAPEAAREAAREAAEMLFDHLAPDLASEQAA